MCRNLPSLAAGLLLAGLLGLLPGRGAPVNINSSMELGPQGEGAPGYRLQLYCLDRTVAAAQPGRLYLPRTVGEGNPGKCLLIPGYAGVERFRLELADLSFHDDCDVVISFDARVGADEQGNPHKDSGYFVDFRAMYNKEGEKWPMLTSFPFAPSEKWTHFSRQYAVKKNENIFNVWICGKAGPGSKTLNGLYVDNFEVKIVGQDDPPANEVAVLPDRLDAVYAPGDVVGLKVRALLNAPGDQENIDLETDWDGERGIERRSTVVLNKVGKLDGADPRSVYEGELKLEKMEFGSFSTRCQIGGQAIRSAGGDFVVLHPVATKTDSAARPWRIGYNPAWLCPAGEENLTDYYKVFNSGGFENAYRVAHLAGLDMARIWGFWIYVEPEEGRFRKEVIGPAMEACAKYGIEPLFILGGEITVRGENRKGAENFPAYLQSSYQPAKRDGSIVPPLADFDRYLDYVLNSWGDRIKYWEVFNEPGIGSLDAAAYLPYLREAYRVIKARSPDDVVLGNGVTGDFGMNVIKWCESLNAADPDYENDLDMVAFHPYGGSLDYENGRYFLLSKTIADIRATLRHPKPMANTECFFLTDPRHPQIKDGLHQSLFGAGEAQRHIMENIANGIVVMTPFSELSFYKRDAPVTMPALSPVVAGTNALSAMIDGMTRHEPIEVGKFTRAGIFLNEKGQGTGYVYDLRPSGSLWHIPDHAEGTSVLDLFGNPVDAGKALNVGYEPYWIEGSAEEIRKLLLPANFSANDTSEGMGEAGGSSGKKSL